jgi:hypothetical protein
MKIALSGEFRFKILGNLKGPFLTWATSGMFMTTDENLHLQVLKPRKHCFGYWFGLRYDLSFVIRFDLGFKTYNP